MPVHREREHGLLGAPAPIRYSAAVAVTLVALLLKQRFAAYLEPTFILFYPAVMVAAVFGGLGPGLAATILSAFLSALWVLPSQHGAQPLDAADVVGLAAFTLMGGFMSLVAAVARRRARQLARFEREREFLAQLAAERERLDVTLRSIGDAVIATDQAARITIMNGVAEALTGWSTVDAVGRPLGEVFRIVAEGTREPAEDPVTRVLREGSVVGLANSSVLIARDGIERPIADSGAPIRDASGAIHGVVLVFRDQTAERHADRSRCEAEERLAQSEELYRTLFQLNPSGVILVDEDGAIRAFNDQASRQLGYDREQFGHLHIHDIDPAEPEPGLVRAHLARIAELGADEFEAAQRTRSGELRTVLVSARPVQVAGRRQFLAVWQDVTERRSLEQQLRQAQKLESVGRLAGGVAHDFNNILTVILSCTEALRRSSGLHDPDAIENVQEIAAAGERARDLTRQLLAFARKQVIAPVLLDLGEQVRSLQKMLVRLLGEDVELQVALEPGLWTVNADLSQVEQVLLNLAVNARDAMPTGGRLSIATRNRTVTDQDTLASEGLRPGDWVQLVVGDTGGGLTPEAQAHLFEPFFTTKDPGKGTGLGLATVYGIVTQAGGHIHVASEPGRGTTFELCFPRVLQAPAPAPSPRTPATTAGTESVLVVEDDPQVRSVIVRALTSEGYRVRAAANPREALELGPEHLTALKLLVTDVVMPGMDGHALATQLTSRHPRLKVLYLSGYSGDAISQRGVLDSGIEFLAKPFTRSNLLDKVRAVLDAG
jgi:PAS domain S-box-containing protein